VKHLVEVFETDWAKTDLAAKEAKEAKKEEKKEIRRPRRSLPKPKPLRGKAPHSFDCSADLQRCVEDRPTGIPPFSLWRLIASRPADAMHPQFEQSGFPPN
jgi:hypothetical protein